MLHAALTLVLLLLSTVDAVALDESLYTAKKEVGTETSQYFYWSYGTSPCGGGISGIRGYTAADAVTVTGGKSPDGSCPAAIACLYDPDSSECNQLDPVGSASVAGSVYPNGTLYECDTVLPTSLNMTFCETQEPFSCLDSDGGWPDCDAQYLPDGSLDNATLFANAEEADQLAGYYYIAYYDDKRCTHPVGIRGFLSGRTYTLPRTTTAASCYDAMNCLYNPTGSKCQELGDDVSTNALNFSFTVDPNKEEVVNSCQGTLANLMPQADCVEETPDQCIASSVFATSSDDEVCNFRIVSASFLARNPEYLIKEGFDTITESAADASVAASLNTLATPLVLGISVAALCCIISMPIA